MNTAERDGGRLADEVVADAERVRAETRKSIPRRVLIAVPRALVQSILIVLVPVLGSRLTGWSLGWVVLATGFAYIIWEICVRDLSFRAKEKWAAFIVQQAEVVRRLSERLEESVNGYDAGKRRLLAVERCSTSLSKVLRQFVRALKAAPAGGDDIVRATAEFNPIVMKAALRNLCKCVHEVVSSFGKGRIRCGVVLPDHRGKRYYPVVVYDPTNSNYCSQHVFDADCFSARVLDEFEKHKLSPQYKEYTAFSGRSDTPLRLIPVSVEQHGYLQDVIGNVVYFRSSATNVEALAVLNIDSDAPRGLPLDQFRELQRWLAPIYRLMAFFLIALRASPFDLADFSSLDETAPAERAT